MSQITAYIGASADDWDSTFGTSGTTLYASKLNSSGGTTTFMYLKFDTSAIGATSTVTAATLNWYDHSYVKSKTATYERSWWTYNGLSYDVAWSSPATVAAGWKSASLDITNISKDGYTQIKGSVGDPGGTLDRTWQVRSYDYDAGHAYRAYLVVDYTEASSGRKKTMVLR